MSKVRPSNRILLVAPYWSGDQQPMRTLLHLLSDLEPAHCELADLLIVNRFDTPAMEQATIDHMARKFNVFQHNTKRRGMGWPHGCNSTALGALEWVYSMMNAGRIPNYKALFMMEADCTPLNRDWIKIFHHQWLLFKDRVFVAGKQIEAPGVHRHINGNCFLSGNLKFLNWLVKQKGEPAQGWDYALAEDFRRWGVAEMPGLHCFWNTPSMSQETLWHLKNTGTIWLHGCKSNDALAFARKTLL